MTDLTDKWKAGEIESLGELVKQIEEVDNRRALSDEYLIEIDNAPRSEYAPAEEWGYGIVWAMSDYVLPYLKELQALNEENARLKELLKNMEEALNLDMCARDLSHALQECQRLEAENEKLRKLLRRCVTPVKDYYHRHDGKWDLTDRYYHDYDEKKLTKYIKLHQEIKSILQKQQI